MKKVSKRDSRLATGLYRELVNTIFKYGKENPKITGIEIIVTVDVLLKRLKQFFQIEVKETTGKEKLPYG